MSELLIRYDEVRRGGRRVLESGEVRTVWPMAVGLVGINGSGKSSLFMQLAGALSGSRGGAIQVAGREATLAYVPQHPSLPPWLTAPQAARLYGLSFSRLTRSMERLYLHELGDAPCRRLSLGQQQALAIALALGQDADVTLLDEPFSALDFRRRIGALELVRERVVSGRGAVVVASQAATDLSAVCGHYLVLRDGAVAFNGSPADLAPDGDGMIEDRLLALLT